MSTLREGDSLRAGDGRTEFELRELVDAVAQSVPLPGPFFGAVALDSAISVASPFLFTFHFKLAL